MMSFYGRGSSPPLLAVVNVRFGSKADIEVSSGNVCFTLKSRHWNSAAQCPLCAKSRHYCTAAGWRYSMTSSAVASSDGGTVIPSAFAVFRLITNSNLVGCSTGRSAGLVPLSILSTYSAVRRNMAVKLGP